MFPIEAGQIEKRDRIIPSLPGIPGVHLMFETAETVSEIKRSLTFVRFRQETPVHPTLLLSTVSQF